MLALSIVLAAVLAMTLAWAIVRKTGDGGWADVVWSFSVGLVGAGAAFWPAADASPARQILVAGLLGAWSVRLGVHILVRTLHAERADPRYEELTQKWGGWGVKAWGFMMIQAVTVVALATSVRAAAARPEAMLDWRDGLAVLIVLIAVAGEGLADRQMAAFRRDPANKSKVADAGLWAWSRHPNYFFEWFGWLAWPVIAIQAGYALGWASLIAPVMMWWLLNHVSGVPMLEAQMLRSRPEAYRAYQTRVSRFFPLPPKRVR